METKTIKVYEFKELNEKAQEKVIEKFRNEDFFFMDCGDLEDYITGRIKGDLGVSKIKYSNIKVRYSLSNCQGDGLSFTGQLEYKGKTFCLTVGDNMYCHKFTINFDSDNATEKELNALKELVFTICSKAEKNGYEMVEYSSSNENIKELIDCNDYKFFFNGSIYSEELLKEELK